MHKSINRRTFLRGAGSVAIALPYLEEMSVAGAAEPPARLITMSFGLGIPREQVERRFDGPLEPFAPFADKMAFFSRLDMSQAHEYGSGTTHFKTGDVLFVGEPQKNEYTAAGPSIEQILLKELHPTGPPTLLSSESAGLWFTYRAPSRYICHWNYDGSPGPAPERRPSRLFDRLFGTLQGGDGVDTADAERERRVKQSILDTVLEEYKFAVSERSYLGAASKLKLQTHLDGIRNVEQRLIPSPDSTLAPTLCLLPQTIEDPPTLAYEQDMPETPQPEGVFKPHTSPIDHREYLAAFQLHAELFALAMRCDILRFGSLLFCGKGGNLQFTGQYTGDSVGTIDFDLETATDSIHNEVFHKGRLDKVAQYQHFAMSGLASALAAFDDPTFLEANGKTVLDNTLVAIGTEYGNDHETTSVFHAIAGGHGHFKSGYFADEANVIDLYHTLLMPYGVDSGIGSRHATFRYSPTMLSSVLV